MTAEPEKRWVVGTVRTGHEIPTAARIEELGAEVYCPKATRKTRPAGKRRPLEIEEGALPGYLFVDPDTVSDFEEIHRLEWFRSFIRDINQNLATVLDDKLDGLRDRERLGGFTERFYAGPSFVIGEIVKVPGGPCGGLRGQVVACSRGHYLLANLDFTKAIWFSGLTLLGNSV